MFQRQIYLGFLLAAIAGQAAARPDSSMQADVPDNSPDYQYDPDSEYNQEAKDEQQYWEEQEKTMEEGGNDGGDGDRLEDEKEYQEEENDQYREQGNSSANEGQDGAAQHQAAAADHYSADTDTDTDYNADTDTDTVDRYQDKGETNMNSTQDKMENYDAEGKSPSFSYNNQ